MHWKKKENVSRKFRDLYHRSDVEKKGRHLLLPEKRERGREGAKYKGREGSHPSPRNCDCIRGKNPFLESSWKGGEKRGSKGKIVRSF